MKSLIFPAVIIGMIYQTQFAKTIAALLGFDYDVAENKAGGIIESVIDK